MPVNSCITVQEYLGFIMALNEAVQGKALNVECPQSLAVIKTIQMLDKFDEWITQIPPTEQPQRFGNKSFRIWHEKLLEVCSHGLWCKQCILIKIIVVRDRGIEGSIV